MRYGLRMGCLTALAGISALSGLQTAARAQDRITGQVHFRAASKAIKTSGVWVDGEYVGNLDGLKGGNRLRLLPGTHEISVRQAGYSDFTQKVVVEPRGVVEVRVNMDRDLRFTYPDPKTGAEVRLSVNPNRAAVFLDDYYVGTVDQYYGIEHAMLVVPGKHRIKIALAGFKTFETEINLSPRQKFEIKTDLATGSINDADPSIHSENTAPASPVTQVRPADGR
jgi:hypothetical protein